MKKAIIIGAGPAGLTAAYQLLKNSDIKPIILEESGVFGGISQTYNYKNNRIDLGGHRFFTKDQQVMGIWTDLMKLQKEPSLDDLLLNRNRNLQGSSDPEVEDDVFLIRTRVSRIYFLRKFFDYPLSLKPSTFINMGLLRTVRSGFGYLGSCVHKRKETNLENFYINRFGKPLYQMFFEDYTNKLWGKHPRHISASWGAQRVKGLSLSKAILSTITKPFKSKNSKVETSLIEEFYYPKKGPGQLYEKMASEVIRMGGQIIMNARVVNVTSSNNLVSSVTYEENDRYKTIQADYFISSMPIKDLIIGMNDVPDEVYEIGSTLPYRDYMTVGLLLKNLTIKNKTKIKTVNDIVPDCWIYVQERDVKLGRIQIFNNWSPYMVDNFKENVWIGLEYFCNENDEMWNQNDEEFIKFAIEEVAHIGIIDKEAVLDAVRLRVKKAYPAYFDSYDHFDKVKNYLDTFDNLYCIGRNGQHRYNNMDHSMLTAIETVNCILNNNEGKAKIWDVNTEKTYHETKKDK